MKAVVKKWRNVAVVVLAALILAVLPLAFPLPASAAEVEVAVADLNAGTTLASYQTGDTLRIVGSEPLNAAGWEILKGASVRFALVFDNGQTSIPDNALAMSAALVSISGAQVARVGERAFFSDIELMSVDFPALSAIEGDAFYSCTKLTAATLSNLSALGKNAFRGCEKLKNASMPVIESIPEGAFANCFALASLSMPNVKTIGRSAFDGDSALTAISLPAATLLESRAFYKASSVTELSLPLVTEIGSEAFSGCTALKILRLENADPSVGENAFTGVGRVTIYSNRKALTDNDYPLYDLANPKDSGGGCQVANIPIPMAFGVLIPMILRRVSKKRRNML